MFEKIRAGVHLAKPRDLQRKECLLTHSGGIRQCYIPRPEELLLTSTVPRFNLVGDRNQDATCLQITGDVDLKLNSCSTFILQRKVVICRQLLKKKVPWRNLRSGHSNSRQSGDKGPWKCLFCPSQLSNSTEVTPLSAVLAGTQIASIAHLITFIKWLLFFSQH